MKNKSIKPVLFSSLSLIALTAIQSGLCSPFSIGYQFTNWPNKSVRVCFGNASHYALTGMPDIQFDEKQKNDLKNGEVLDEVPADVRLKIKTMIQKEYTLARTGITYVGWETCTPTADNADAVILMGKKDFSFDFDGYAAVGRNLDGEHNAVENLEKKAFVYMNRPGTFHKGEGMSDDDFLNILSTHEFGHLSGLAHENFRMSKKNKDPNCELTVDGYPDFMANDAAEGEPVNDPRMENVKAFSKYDPNSVMSYCYWDVLNQATGMKFKQDSKLGEDHKFQPSDNGMFARGAIYLGDPSLYKTKKISTTVSEIQIRAGLSLGDIHTLRCLHGAYKPDVAARKCTLDFDPTRDPDLLKLVGLR